MDAGALPGRWGGTILWPVLGVMLVSASDFYWFSVGFPIVQVVGALWLMVWIVVTG
jgi:hypothetical protein